MPTTCKIQWIDGQGIPTPDTNVAVGIARSTIEYADGTAQVREFPICACHAERMPRLPSDAWDRAAGRKLYTSYWTLLPLPDLPA